MPWSLSDFRKEHNGSTENLFVSIKERKNDICNIEWNKVEVHNIVTILVESKEGIVSELRTREVETVNSDKCYPGIIQLLTLQLVT